MRIYNPTTLKINFSLHFPFRKNMRILENSHNTSFVCSFQLSFVKHKLFDYPVNV